MIRVPAVHRQMRKQRQASDSELQTARCRHCRQLKLDDLLSVVIKRMLARAQLVFTEGINCSLIAPLLGL